MYKDVLGFSITPFMQRVMNINGYYASIMRTGKKSEGDSEELPPGIPIPVLPVDYLKSRPNNWIGGEGSYVCPVDSEWGLWFNFSMNNPGNTAVLSSVKGMNPLTGQRVAGYELEEYQEECPVHHKPFSKGKLCIECGFKWPNQNYISQPNKPFIDGFLTPTGVRQFYFTEDMAKSIPELVIGKEDTVPAFGFCFYKLKDYRPTWEKGKHLKNEFPESVTQSSAVRYKGLSHILGPTGMDSIKLERKGGILGSTGPVGSSGTIGYYGTLGGGELGVPGEALSSSYTSDCYCSSIIKEDCAEESIRSSINFCSTGRGGSSMDTPPAAIIGTDMLAELREAPDFGYPATRTRSFSKLKRSSAEVGIGAGAKINQTFEKSNKPVEAWEKKPTGVVRLYFVFQEQFEKYVEAGFNSLKGNELGYLNELPVGGTNG